MPKSLERKLMFLFVFTTGAVIMSLELTASRVLAPYFGNSIFVWGNIIGVVMIALALGYYFGGKLADKKPAKNLLMYLVLLAGVLISFVPYLVKPISLNILAERGFSFQIFLILGSFFAMLILFSFPLFILGMVSPFIIRLLTENVAESGRIAGSVFASSTFGSIFGTFFSAFIMIPFIGSRQTLLIGAFLLILISALGLIKKPWFLILILIPILIYLFYPAQSLSKEKNLIYEKESSYNLIQVVKSDDRYYLKFNEGLGVQSIYIPGSPLVSAYYDYYSILPYLINKKGLHVLMIGGGGGTIPRIYWGLLAQEFNLTVDVAELDGEVIKAAEKYFEYDKKRTNTIISDGRFFLSRSGQLYDIIIIDAYAQQFYIPWYLTTQEFFQAVRSHLTSQGILAINVNARDYEAQILQSISQTIKSVFNYTDIMPIKYSNNYLVMSSQTMIDFSNLNISNPEIKQLMGESKRDHWPVNEINEKNILTDNKAPIELYTEASLYKII